jgi:hypothetical protein
VRRAYRHLWADCLDNVGSLTSHRALRPVTGTALLLQYFPFVDERASNPDASGRAIAMCSGALCNAVANRGCLQATVPASCKLRPLRHATVPRPAGCGHSHSLGTAQLVKAALFSCSPPQTCRNRKLPVTARFTVRRITTQTQGYWVLALCSLPGSLKVK